jgi:uncharacterized damage-inducible protein DinB
MGMVLKQLTETRDEVLNSINGLSDEELNKAPDTDSWSIAQVIHHLQQIESYFLSLMDAALQGPSEEVKEKNLSYLTDRSHKAKSPIEPSSEFKTKEELISRLNHSREKVVSLLGKTNPDILGEKSLSHPAFGKLSVKQTLEFIAGHEKRHLAQIEEIKQLVVVG